MTTVRLSGRSLGKIPTQSSLPAVRPSTPSLPRDAAPHARPRITRVGNHPRLFTFPDFPQRVTISARHSVREPTVTIPRIRPRARAGIGPHRIAGEPSSDLACRCVTDSSRHLRLAPTLARRPFPEQVESNHG